MLILILLKENFLELFFLKSECFNAMLEYFEIHSCFAGVFDLGQSRRWREGERRGGREEGGGEFLVMYKAMPLGWIIT